jgi:hypothetical protein
VSSHLLARALVHPLPVKLDEPARERSGEIRMSSQGELKARSGGIRVRSSGHRARSGEIRTSSQGMLRACRIGASSLVEGQFVVLRYDVVLGKLSLDKALESRNSR